MTLQEFTDIISEIIFVEYDIVKKVIEKDEGESKVLTIKIENEDIFKINISKINQLLTT